MSTFTRTAAPLARFQAESPWNRKPQSAAVIQTDHQGDEADWLEWYLQAAPQALATNDDLRALALLRGKKIAPGSIDQHDAYIREHDGQPFGTYIKQLRQKAIFGLWADGTKNGPPLPHLRDIGIPKLKWLLGQASPCKYLKWYRANDPAGWAAFVAANPQYAIQGGPAAPTLAVFSEVDAA